MTAILVSVAQGVADELNQNQDKFSCGFCAVRSYADWDIALEENANTIGKLFCDVVPVTYTAADRETRGHIAYEVPVEVVFRKLIPQESRDTATGRIQNEQIDDLQAFAEGVYEFMLQPTQLSTYPAAALMAQAWVTAYGRVDGATESQLRLMNQWTSAFRLTYHVQQPV